MTNTDGITTDELLGALHRRGLAVTSNMLGQDVKAGYLPPLLKEPRGPSRGIGRLWTPLAAERAIYLYRLRRRGAKGPVLRLLLFLRDGWDWEGIKPVCQEGLAKCIAIERSPLARKLRERTPEAVDFVISDVTEGVFVHGEIPRFSWGIGLFGRPLPGGSLQALFGAIAQVYGSQVPPEMVRTVELLIGKANLTWDRGLRILAEADALLAEIARQEFKAQLVRMRHAQWQLLQRHGIKDVPASPLSLGGMPPDTVQTILRQLPHRPTAGQLLGASFAMTLVSVQALRELGITPEWREATFKPM